jgi:hypothetical protein
MPTPGAAPWNEERALLVPQRGVRHRLALEEVRVEPRRATHGLCGVVDQDVEARLGVEEVAREDLDAGRVAQIEPVHRQT